MLLVESQDVAVKRDFLRIEMLNAVTTHVKPRLAEIAQCPFGDTGQTGDGGEVKVENRVAVLEPMRNCSVEVSVDDPFWLFELKL